MTQQQRLLVQQHTTGYVSDMNGQLKLLIPSRRATGERLAKARSLLDRLGFDSQLYLTVDKLVVTFLLTPKNERKLSCF